MNHIDIHADRVGIELTAGDIFRHEERREQHLFA